LLCDDRKFQKLVPRGVPFYSLAFLSTWAVVGYWAPVRFEFLPPDTSLQHSTSTDSTSNMPVPAFATTRDDPEPEPHDIYIYIPHWASPR